MPELHFEEGSNLEPLPLYPGPLLLGRDAECDRVIQHKKVSKRHAIIERNKDGWFIQDAGSTNGTTVNGVRCKGPHPIYHQDLIGFGALHATFEARSVPPPPPEAPQRFQRTEPELPTERGPLDLPSRPLRHLATTLWIVVGIGLALFIYLTVLTHQRRGQAFGQVSPPSIGERA